MSGRTALRWSGYVAIAIVFAIVCVYLSNWQFTRNATRDAQLSLIAENYDAEPVSLADLLPVGASFDDADEWHPVTLVGEYLVDDTLLARNRAHGGTSAFEVLVPFLTEDGRIVVVDRGWLPPGEDQANPDEIPDPVTGSATVTVRLRPSEALPNSGRSAPDGQVPTINVPLIAETIGSEAVIDEVYGLMVSESPAAATAPQALESPSEDPGPHLSYAIQWILFAVMGFVFIWYMIRTEIRHRREDAEEAAGGEPAVVARQKRKRERRDRDMKDEDALLDELTPR